MATIDSFPFSNRRATRFSVDVCSMVNDRSRRWTLLCWLTICLSSFLLLIFFSIELADWNRETSFNVIKYRSSLIRCGRSAVDRVNNSHWFHQFESEEFSLRELLVIASKRGEFLSWLERIERECLLARQWTVDEQQRPKRLRTLISFARKEFFYLMNFFTSKVSF